MIAAGFGRDCQAAAGLTIGSSLGGTLPDSIDRSRKHAAMDQLLVFIIPPTAGLITYIVLRLISKHVKIDVLHDARPEKNGAREAVRPRDPSADGSLGKVGRLYATLNQWKDTAVVVFGNDSLYRHMLDLVATYQHALTRWRRPQMTNIEKQRQIERRLAATISCSTPPRQFREERAVVDDRLKESEKITLDFNGLHNAPNGDK
jgi:hypothetical protein